MTMKILVFSFLVMTSVSCSQPNVGGTRSGDQSDTFFVQEELIKTGVLKIFLPKNRPDNMSIMAPDGRWFVIQSAEDEIEAIPQIQFENSNTLEFKISELEGVFWDQGTKMKGLVFSDRGKYVVYFSDNLETEPENTFSFSKTVTY